MAGEGMAQYMWRNLARIDARITGQFLQQLCQAVAGQMSTGASAREEPTVVFFALQELLANFPVSIESLSCGRPEWDHPLAAALAAHQQRVGVACYCGEWKPYQLGNT